MSYYDRINFEPGHANTVDLILEADAKIAELEEALKRQREAAGTLGRVLRCRFRSPLELKQALGAKREEFRKLEARHEASAGAVDRLKQELKELTAQNVQYADEARCYELAIKKAHEQVIEYGRTHDTA